MIDPLGHPLVKGATVLTLSYGGNAFDTIATIKKVNRKTAVVTVKKRDWYKDGSGNWQVKELDHDIKREPRQMIVIDQQLNYNRETYPEHLI